MASNEYIELLKKDLVQVTEPKPDDIAEIVKQIIGDTPLRDFGNKVGMSASTLSRIINGKITKPLSSDTILNIALCSDESTEYMLAVYQDLAAANGMMSRSEQQALQQHMSLRKERGKMHQSVKKMMSTVILARLAERGIALNNDGDCDSFLMSGAYLKNISEIGLRYDFRMDVEGEYGNYAWAIFAFPQSEESFPEGEFAPRNIADRLMKELSPVFVSDSWQPDLYNQAKISFCFIDWQLFECFCHLFSEAKLNNRFSAILIDEESMSVKEERIFKSDKFPDGKSLFDLPPIMSISCNADEVAEEITGDDFLIFEETEGGE